MKTMTKTAGKTATSKSVANAKAGKAVRTLSLQQQLIKAERDLKNIVNRQLGETVLHAQELIVKQLKPYLLTPSLNNFVMENQKRSVL